EWNLPACRHVAATTEIVTEYPEIVKRDVRKLRAACNFAERPNTLGCCFQPLIDLNVSAICQFNASEFQSDICCVWSAARCDKQMTTLQRLFHTVLLNNNLDSLPRLSRYTFHRC